MAVTMSDLNDRISALEGVTPKTPITMKSLNDRLTALEESSVVSIVTINKSGSNTYPIPAEHQGKNFAIIGVNVHLNALGESAPTGQAYIENGNKFRIYTRNGKNLSVRGDTTMTFSSNGNSILATISGLDSYFFAMPYPTTIKVLFYK